MSNIRQNSSSSNVQLKFKSSKLVSNETQIKNIQINWLWRFIRKAAYRACLVAWRMRAPERQLKFKKLSDSVECWEINYNNGNRDELRVPSAPLALHVPLSSSVKTRWPPRRDICRSERISNAFCTCRRTDRRTSEHWSVTWSRERHANSTMLVRVPSLIAPTRRQRSAS